LSLGSSDKIAPHLSQLAPTWVQSLLRVMVTEEKTDAMWGFNLAILKNPQAMETCLLDYFNMIAGLMIDSNGERSTAPPTFLKDKEPTQSFQQVIATYRAMIPDFNAFLANLPGDSPELFNKLDGYINEALLNHT